MTTTQLTTTKRKRRTEVLPVNEARKEISTILKGFTEGTNPDPVFIGAHRKAEAVLLPVSFYEAILDYFDDIEIAKLVRERTDGPFLRTTVEELAKSVGLEWPPKK